MQKWHQCSKTGGGGVLEHLSPGQLQDKHDNKSQSFQVERQVSAQECHLVLLAF
jgi:hypothetical protein